MQLICKVLFSRYNKLQNAMCFLFIFSILTLSGMKGEDLLVPLELEVHLVGELEWLQGPGQLVYTR